MILFGCFEVPGWGGLTTATYRLFETLLGTGLDVHYLNLIPGEKLDYFREVFGPTYGNPKSLPNVHHSNLVGPLHEPHPELRAVIEHVAPNVIVGVGDIASYLMKRASPERRLLFLTSGSQQVSRDAPFTEQQAVFDRAVSRPPIVDFKEHFAVAASDLIITHSEMAKLIYLHFYPEHAHKIHREVIWFAEWIHQDAASYSAAILPFEERDIGVLFIASTWARKEKNYDLVRALASRLDGMSIHIVGEVPDRFGGVRFHGIVGDRMKLFKLMARAKTVASPSLFDTAPGVLFEASAMDCNVVASKNCGNWFLCHDALLVDPFSVDTFVEKITLAQSRKFPDNMDCFFRFESYKKLIGMLIET